MDVKAAGKVGLFILEKGGLRGASDARTAVEAYMAMKSGKASIASLLTPSNLDAFENLLKILVAAVQDQALMASLTAIVQSL